MIYVMSDIHGNLQRFRSVMEQIDLQPEDTLYVLGDVIDRYPDGIGILQQLIRMPNAQILRGDHEQTFLYMYESCPDEVRIECDADGDPATWVRFIALSAREQSEIIDAIRAMPLQTRIRVHDREFILVHAAPAEMYDAYSDRFELESFSEEIEDFVLGYRIRLHDTAPDGVTVIRGHTPAVMYNTKLPAEIRQTGSFIHIDCGCGCENGRLACLRLQDMKVFYSEDPTSVQKP